MAKASGIGWTTFSVDDATNTQQAIVDDITDVKIATPRAVQDITGMDKSALQRLLLLADLTLTTAAYLGWGAAAVAAGATTMLRLSDDGDLMISMLADTDLYILWVGSACPVQVVGMNAAALVA